ncbi:YiiX/YebB-like N1pC/P60 family cysteine hydrolase [Endozoicomonas sp. GU-1]|uniref:YiiX/YebB-like N1pC/P60 family cysteine hydrolase n=1 Tax=Endozoicomonas sp. GU-1 TaxID=3009078 RepID=UPI0022B2D4AB|nr:YiiX/YebB-like N1pC/P60 family cysteine hydrolase [Endozoicomonas sp. GU-1]WBA81774.1 YiiX/YebB-like N1pC/P60 family cysteine hydrolase [Endozoicomonas sp. GU-1]WBA84729.1 YiiX/YebB-like N1pC/P60 family cysteine hydrolase [Endozoicomonas sp. GU-1]
MDKALPVTVMPANVIAKDLLPGDLLFQLRSGGEAEWVISRLFSGRDGAAINHVALYDGDGMVIEAVMPRVQKTALDGFVSSSVLDNHGRPCVLVCRLASSYSALVPDALAFAEQQLAVSYDPHYRQNQEEHQKSWYCSELIVHAFRHANKGIFLFEETPMSFRDMATGELMPFWVDHYQAIGQEIPEGLPGSHPALLSCSDKLMSVNRLGSLPAKSCQDLCSLEPGSTLA